MSLQLPPPPDRYVVRDQVELRRLIAQEFTRLSGAISSITFTNGRTVTTGEGSPENVVTARIGSLYLRSDGGAGTSLYVKESGDGNTGWAAK